MCTATLKVGSGNDSHCIRYNKLVNK